MKTGGCMRFRIALLVAACAVGPLFGALPANAFPCAQPVSDGPGPGVADCRFLLAAAVGSVTCARPCACDIDGDQAILARDVLGCLRHVVGLPVPLTCPRCTHPVPDAFAHASVDLEMPWTEGYYYYDDFPERLDVHIFLDAEGKGAVSLARPDLIVAPIATLTPVTWSMPTDVISIAPGHADVFPYGEFDWSAWTLSLEDTNGDGVLDGGGGAVKGEFVQQLSGDVYDTWSFAGSFATRTDKLVPTLALYGPRMHISRSIFTSDAPLLRTSEPILIVDILERVRFLSGGVPLAARVEIEDGIGAFATQARFYPSEFLPFDGTFTLDPGGLTDAAGNVARWSEEPLYTPPDPGSAIVNAGFEGSGGWSGLEVCGRVDVVVPTEGRQQACLLDYGELDGYIDLDPAATELVFSVAALAFNPYWGAVEHATVYVIHPKRTVIVYDAQSLIGESVPYGCGSYGEQCAALSPRDVVVDVSDVAGERVFLHAYVESLPPFTYYALLLDDVRVR